MAADPTGYEATLNRHYGRPGLLAAIDTAARNAGLNPDALTPDDLAPLDQFHHGGQGTTRELALLGGLASGEWVLDSGGGLGGPARLLAREFGCYVTVLDV